MNYPLQPKALGMCWRLETEMEHWTAEAKVTNGIPQVNLNH